MSRILPAPADLLARLVRCPSVNPARNPVSETTGETRMTTLLGEILRPWTDDIVLTEVAPGRTNFLARFPGRDRSRCYAFEAHSDTVGIEGMTIDPFGAETTQGRLFGRGACDTKGPMTAMLLALLRHVQRHGTPACDLLFLSACDEELGGMGARRMREDGLRCDGMIIGEPTNLQLIDRHKGAMRFRLTVHGKAAHSAYPEFGCNAIHAAARFIRTLEDSVAAQAAAAEWPEPGPPTVSVGVMHGGDQVNRIPDEAVLDIDFRVPPGWQPATVEHILSDAAGGVRQAVPGAELILETTQNYPAFQLTADSPFRRNLEPLVGDPNAWQSARYATNAGFFASGGIPCLVFGPGSPGDAHTANESIDLAELDKATERLEAFLEGL
jgi:acetylornithine deacetylase/succinyl-diaminopimelate desuccinylase family protein